MRQKKAAKAAKVKAAKVDDKINFCEMLTAVTETLDSYLPKKHIGQNIPKEKEAQNCRTNSRKGKRDCECNCRQLGLLGFLATSDVLSLITELRKLIFVDFFAQELLQVENIYVRQNNVRNVLLKLQPILQQQIFTAMYYGKAEEDNTLSFAHLAEQAHEHSVQLLKSLPRIRTLLDSDAKAAYLGDPACEFPGLPILCYPGILSLTYHRIAHELYKYKIPLLPRVMSELAHSQTGIDIHPGAEIGDSFFIDHGTGVVIGETTVIGHNVTIYHGVTLGAKNFPKDKNGNILKGARRHPIIGNNVVIYSHAVILGCVNIGDNSVIGGNVWLTKDVPPNSVVYQKECGAHLVHA